MGALLRTDCSKWGCRKELGYEQVQKNKFRETWRKTWEYLPLPSDGVLVRRGLIKAGAYWEHESLHIAALRLQLIPEPTRMGRNSPPTLAISSLPLQKKFCWMILSSLTSKYPWTPSIPPPPELQISAPHSSFYLLTFLPLPPVPQL